jgi:hypothetical protein
MSQLFGYLYLEILLRVTLSWNNSKEKFLQSTSLGTVVEKGDGALDKEATSNEDLFDKFRLPLQFWH